jgi:putative phage-type endonuclease
MRWKASLRAWLRKSQMAEQGTDEWLAERVGKVTASRIGDLMAKTKSGPGAARKNYMAELLTERLTGQPKEGFTSTAMQWGTEQEPRARAMYSFLTENDVVETGFVPHPDILMTGASPDGLVGDNGLVEIKCPNTATHIETLRGASIDGKYIKQMHWQMVCCKRDWCDFVSFDPRLPEPMQLHVQRVERDDKLADEITQAVEQFLTELNQAEADLRARYELKENT